MTVSEAFEQFKSELELTDRGQDQAAAAQKTIRERMAAHFPVQNSFLTSSYARHTKIAPLSDIDVFFVRNSVRVPLSTDGSGVFPSVAIDQLAQAVVRAYPTGAKITKQSRSVNVEITGLSFGFDLIPAWYRSPDGYWIPDADANTWLATDPERHAAMMTASNKRCDDKLKPLIKMAKHWSRRNYDRLRSFHVELICAAIFASREITNWRIGMMWFLVDLSAYIGTQMMDPVYGSTRVDKMLNATEHSELLSRASNDAQNAISAVELENAGDHAKAIEKWKHIFISGFPS